MERPLLVPIQMFLTKRVGKHRKEGKWTERKGLCPVGDFRYQFKVIMAKAGIEKVSPAISGALV